jgi:hypothetical protein
MLLYSFLHRLILFRVLENGTIDTHWRLFGALPLDLADTHCITDHFHVLINNKKVVDLKNGFLQRWWNQVVRA